MAMAALVAMGCARVVGAAVTLTVHNSTTVPIVVVEQSNEEELVVPACSSERFLWDDGWQRISGAASPFPPASAIQVPVSAVPWTDGAQHTLLTVTAGSVTQESDARASVTPPPCAGLPPSPVPSAVPFHGT